MESLEAQAALELTGEDDLALLIELPNPETTGCATRPSEGFAAILI